MHAVAEGDEEAAGPLEIDGGLTPLMFHLLLLSRSNRAVCPKRAAEAAGPLDRPMTEYLVASSHNSYLMEETRTPCHPMAPPCHPYGTPPSSHPMPHMDDDTWQVPYG